MDKVSFVWTIIIGLVIGIGANVLTPYIRMLLGKVSASTRHRNERKREMFDKAVLYLIENPNDEINLRIEKNLYYVVAAVIVSAALIIAVISSDIVEMVASILMAMIGLFLLIVGFKYHRLLIATWERRKKEGLDILD